MGIKMTDIKAMVKEEEDSWQIGFDAGFNEGYAQGQTDLVEELEANLFEKRRKNSK